MDGRDYAEDVKPFGQDKEDNKGDGKYGRVCYVCCRPESKIGSMIFVPGRVNLCHDYMQKAFGSATEGDIGFSEFPNIPYMNMSLSDLNVTPPTMEIPKRQEIERKSQERPVLITENIPTPHVTKGKLDEYMIGQEEAKKVVSMTVYGHYKRAFLSGEAGQRGGNAENAGPDDMVIEKSNILMVGPTEGGKAYLVKTLARFLDVPLAIADATPLTEAGYTDDDTESMVSELLVAADNDVERAQRGIIFTDGTSKTAEKKQANTGDVSSEFVQQELPKLLEGSAVEVPVGSNQKNAITSMAIVNTDNILPIYGGAFPDLEEIIKERLKKKSPMGFGSVLKDTYDSDSNIPSHVTNEDLHTFGMIPEFLGGLPVTVTPRGLTEDMMIRILKEPGSAITRQCKKPLSMSEIRFVFKDGTLIWVTEKALKRGTGARTLQAILGEFMLDIIYRISKDPSIGSAVVTRPCLEKDGRPLVRMRG